MPSCAVAFFWYIVRIHDSQRCHQRLFPQHFRFATKAIGRCFIEPIMSESTRRVTKAIVAIALASLAIAANISAQTDPKPKPADQADDVVRVNTELVQTDVMVFDKQGRFV